MVEPQILYSTYVHVRIFTFDCEEHYNNYCIRLLKFCSVYVTHNFRDKTHKAI